MFNKPMYDLAPEEVIDYLRKSRSDDPLLSVEEVLRKHEAELDEWAERNLGGKVPEENKFREVVSGETLKERPEINKVLRMIESPKYKAVAVVEPQRLTRGDLEDIGRLMKLLKHTNTLVITPQRTYDLRDEYDWDAFERELKRGNDYLEYTKKILNRGRLRSVSEGNYIGSIPPYGYNKITIQEGKFKCPTLEINEKEADVVRMMFDMFVTKGMNRAQICRQFDDMGIKAPKGEFWSPNAMRDMLMNIHYLGKVRWNFRKTITIVEDSELIETRPAQKIGEYLIYEGKHEAIISEELFNAAQEAFGKNPKVKARNKVINPLTGLIYCRCGSVMSMRLVNTKNTKPRYICNNKRCEAGSCKVEDILDRISDILKECIADFELRLQNDEGDSVKLHARLIKNLEAKKKELESKELAQWESQSDPNPENRMPQHIFKTLNERLIKEKDEVQQALCKAYESMPEPVDYEAKIERFQDAIDALNDPDVDAAKKNKLLKSCIARITCHRDKPERLRRTEPRRRTTVNGKRKVVSDLKTGANWTNPPIELDVELRV